MKSKLKNIFLSLSLVALSFAFLATAKADVGDCGNNFTAGFTYMGKRANTGDPFTAIVPVGYEFKTNLSMNAEGEDSLKAGENVEIMLVMDRSGSMNDTVGGTKKVTAAKASLNVVADTFIVSGDSDNRLGLVTYNSNVTLDQSLTSNYNRVKDAINSFSASGQTNISGALMNAANHLKANADSDAKKIIVLATDGKHNLGMPMSFGIRSVGSDTAVFTVGIGNDADETLLRKIASEAGNKEGRYYYSDVGDLQDIFRDIIEGILIPFRPENITATFYRDNADKFDLLSTTPNYSAVSNGEVSWNSLGAMLNGESRDFDMIYRQASGIGNGMPVNTGDLLVTYDLFGSSCSEIVPIDIITIDNVPQCTGAVPDNATICSGDDSGLSADSARTLVSGCSAADKCEYTCDPGFELKNGKCVISGKCGPAEKEIWCRDTPTSGWCDTGSTLVEGPTPYGNRWTWVCAGSHGGPSTSCRAVRACGEGWKEVSL